MGGDEKRRKKQEGGNKGRQTVVFIPSESVLRIQGSASAETG